RRQDTEDRRTVKLFFTQRGLQLIEDSVFAMEAIEAQLREQMGEPAFARFCSGAETLYRQLDLEHGLVKPFRPELVAALDETDLQPAAPAASTGEIVGYLENLLCKDKPSDETEHYVRTRLNRAELAELARLLGKLRTPDPD
ncbi:MAG: hypothetical protein R3311_21465, partial [Oceanisphaera sp.]|nr:hypothetical protein [Oceanisphaera sp.]